MSTDTILEAVNVEKEFFSTEPPTKVLRGISLQVRQGEFLCVMGASGSGKSTLLYCLSGMDRPTTGSVLLAGRDLTRLRDAELSKVRLTEMGFVFQQPHFLDNLNIRDNVLLPAVTANPKHRDAAAEKADALLERFGIAHGAHHGITEVSGGQLQRAAICRALAGGPAVIFADEPTGALNSTMSEEVMDAFTEAHRDGATIVMVTHNPRCASRADRVVYLRDGVIVNSRTVGAWSAALADERDSDTVAWLREQGF